MIVDRRGRLQGSPTSHDADESQVPELTALVAEALREARWGLLVVSRRPEVPDDIAELEITWEEACAAARRCGLILLDWIVVAEGRFASSVAEFAPSRPAWSIGDEAKRAAESYR